MQRIPKQAVALVAAMILIGLYWLGAHRENVAQNSDPTHHDQKAVMHYSERIVSHHYAYDGPRNRMPLYPYLQSVFYHPPEDEQAFFERGKRVNVVLSLIVLAGVAGVFFSRFPFHPAGNAVVIAAFTVFIFKAPFFQPELLYYGLSFAAFLLMWRMLTRPGWLTAIACGAVLALGHLTKASILPGLGLFVLCYYGKALFGPRGPAAAVAEPAATRHGRGALILQGLAVIVVFLATLSPYLMTSKRIYESYFYNVNSTFYMWCDSWDEAKSFSETYDDRHALPNLPAEMVPGPRKYLREHSVGQIFGRVWRGFWQEVTACSHSYGYFKYFVLYFAVIGYCAFRNFDPVRALVRERPFLALFLLLYFTGYFMLYAWYMPVARGQRFVLALFLPLLYTSTALYVQLARGVGVKIGARPSELTRVTDWAVSALCVLDICLTLTHGVTHLSGGS